MSKTASPSSKPLDWRYSRSQQRHWVEDGEYYGRSYARLYVIVACRQFLRDHQPKDGYDLFCKGRFKAHGMTVKELKQKAQDHHNKNKT